MPQSTKCLAYGLDKNNQDLLLNQMNDLIFNMRVHGKKSLMPFQKGILMSNNSLRNLYSDVNEMYGIKYIITRVLNQDVLENCFSYLRGMGAANTHPTPLGFRYRLN